ncbi:MAG: 2-amino-4-hydroxy-6-hydroxymethyldihydropteridine diphosphokinase [Gammaproteobacteria bacterium]|jgi:2-amino-4-hydroxy-6-hydroxymethyldihydropteridine diphosphokinase|nr:2-amino-4-hydroxy-6-hydroxymethyldihydropteridine diphosphokinase [Gammaproteobacteria bacterium]
MAKVFAGLGSNIDPEDNLHLGVRELRARYGELQLSAVYRSKSVGFDGHDFLNLVACFETEASPESICEEIERIHELAGRDRNDGKWSARSLDIDLLLYDDLVVDDKPVRIPRNDVLEYSFVLRPLAELAPEFRHPVTGKTMREHWQEFDAASHPLEVVGVIL